MFLGLLLCAALTGVVAAIVVLALGGGWGAALAAYSLGGMLGMLVAAAIGYLVRSVREGSRKRKRRRLSETGRSASS